MYQALTAQQSLVLSQIYNSIPASSGRLDGNNYRCDLAQVLGKVHCCPGCTCTYVNSENRISIESRFSEATNTEQFSKIFVGWNTDGTVLAMFGVLKENPTTSIISKFFSDENPLALIGEWAISGSLPSYEEQLGGVRKTYHSFWIGRVILGLIALFGLYLMVPAIKEFGYPEAFNKQPSSFVGMMLVTFASIPAYFSFQKYRLLFRQ